MHKIHKSSKGAFLDKMPSLTARLLLYFAVLLSLLRPARPLTARRRLPHILHVVADDTDRTPDDYGSAFLMLAEIGVVGPELADRLRLATGLRNLLVHAYLDIDPDRLWAHLDHLDDLDAFALAVTEYLV